jgi:5-methylcytosine-specific restriction protein A
LEVDDLSFQNEINDLDIEPEMINDVPKDIIQNSITTTKEIFKKSVITSKSAIIHANYLCEVNKDHPYFLSVKSGQNFVEAHHLIPMKFQKKFRKSLDVGANIIALCVFCHRKIHHAADIKDMLQELYDVRKKRLEKCEISIEFEKLVDIYKQGEWR